MSNRLKGILLLIGMMLWLYAMGPHLLTRLSALTKGPNTSVDYADAAQGRITSVKIERQFHMYYLDDKTEGWYSFNAFMPPLTPAQRQRLSRYDKIDLHLGLQLEVGDYVSKQANSKLITVQRGDSTSRWYCATPEEIEQSRK